MLALKKCIRTVSNSIHVDESNCCPHHHPHPYLQWCWCEKLSRDKSRWEACGISIQRILLWLENAESARSGHHSTSEVAQLSKLSSAPSVPIKLWSSRWAAYLLFAATTIVHWSQSFFKCKTHLKLEALNYDSSTSLRVCRAGRDKVSRWVM